MTWLGSASNREGILQQLPDLEVSFKPFYASFFSLPQLPPVTVELCRLRLAQLHRSDVEWQREEVSLEQSKRAELSNWATDARFTAAERACLAFTEVYAMDVSSITDEQAEAVKTHYGDAGLVALVQALGVFDGLTRVSLLWGLPAYEPSATGET